MESTVNTAVACTSQFSAVILTGLLAGLLYGYDCSVIKGLKDVPDDVYIQTFQSINKAIQNPYFFLSFLGSFLALLSATCFTYQQAKTTTFYLFLFSTIIYLLAVIGTTAFFNVPLNERLAGFDFRNSSKYESQSMRKTFESLWNSYHKIRTVASFIAFSTSLLAAIKYKS